MAQRLVSEYADSTAFFEAVDNELAHGGLLVRGAQPTTDRECVVELRIAGELIAEVSGHIGSVARFGATVVFDEVPADIVALAESMKVLPEPLPDEEPAAPEAPAFRNAAERLATLTVAQKIAQATSGDRETRQALFRDNNKVLHAYVFRNPRLQLDEVLVAVKMSTLSPDALKAAAEHKEFGQNQQVIIAVVRNPKTPAMIALKLLPRLPQNEIRAIAKGGARDQLVAAARKMLAG
jgi:hypothetical protein